MRDATTSLRHVCALAGVITFLLASAAAEPALPEAARMASVVVQESETLVVASDNGVLFYADEDSGLVVVLRNCDPRFRSTPSSFLVIFDAGGDAEWAAPADAVLATEAWTILRVDAPGLRKWQLARPKKPMLETSSVTILGHLPGATPAERQPLTVLPGRVSSVRAATKSRDPRASCVQVSAPWRPGLEGGPVLNDDGELVGVNFGTIPGTQIGEVLPIDLLEALCLVPQLRFNAYPTKLKSGQVEVTFDFDFEDPLHWTREASLHIVAVDDDFRLQDEDALGLVAKNMKRCRLELAWGGKHGVEARASTTVTLKGDPGRSRPYVWQLSLVGADGVARVTAIELNFLRLPDKITAAAQKEVKRRGEELQEWRQEREKQEQAARAREKEGAATTVENQRRQLAELRAAGSLPTPAGRRVRANGEPVESLLSLAGKTTEDGAASWTILAVKAENVPARGLALSADGRSLFIAEVDGLVRRARVPTLVEERELLVGTSLTSLAVSKSGVAAYAAAAGKLFVLDAETLAVQRTVDLPGQLYVLTAPPITTVVGVAADGSLTLLDLDAPAPPRRYTARDLQAAQGRSAAHHSSATLMSSTECPELTADGRYLFALSNNSLRRFVVAGAELRYEAAGARSAGGAAHISISPDSRYVVARSDNGNVTVAGHPQARRGEAYFYAVGDLDRPVFSISNPRSGQIAFDPVAKLLYIHSHGALIQVIQPESQAEEYRYDFIEKLSCAPVNLLVHPEGNRGILHAEYAILWFELPH